jgi:phosphohistidine swiveling domain-containing protein
MAIQWSREESKERFPYPISPLGWSLLRAPTEVSLQALSKYLGFKQPKFDDVVRKINGYVYTQKHYFQTRWVGKIHWRNLFQWIGLLSRTILKTSVRLWINSKAPWHYRVPLLQWIWGIINFRNSKRLYSGAETFNPCALLVTEILNVHVYPIAIAVVCDWNHQKQELTTSLAKSYSLPNPLSPNEFKRLKEEMEQISCRFFLHDFNVYFLKNIVYQGLVFQLRINGYSLKFAQDYLNQALLNLENNFSVNAAKEFQKLPLPDWLRKYGHLTDNWDIMAPLLSELPMERLHRHPLSQTVIQDQNQNPPLLPAPSLLGSTFENGLELFRQLVVADEELRAHSSSQFPAIKKLFLHITQQKDWPSEFPAKDIYFLTIEEIEGALIQNNFLTLRNLILERQREYNQALKSDPPIDWSESLPFSSQRDPKGSFALIGAPISNGVTVGQAILIRSMEDFNNYLPYKHILVVRSANPTYAPYYTSCLGILSERGGLLSHGALVARELEIPMIGEINHLFEEIHSGDLLRIDGSLGTIEVLAKAAPQQMLSTRVELNDEYIGKQSTLTD